METENLFLSPFLQKSPVKGRTLCVIPSVGTSPPLSYSPTSTPPHTSSKSTPSHSNDRHSYQEHEVQVIMLPGERRLGFNVEGGRDQGTHPRVGSITGGGWDINCRLCLFLVCLVLIPYSLCMARLTSDLSLDV